MDADQLDDIDPEALARAMNGRQAATEIEVDQGQIVNHFRQRAADLELELVKARIALRMMQAEIDNLRAEREAR